MINATGVVLHTNLGRAPLADAARAAIDEVARGYSNLEYDLGKGERGSRHDHLRALLRELTGAEDAIVVTTTRPRPCSASRRSRPSKEIVVSRGELIEIGGSFRLPEILALSRGTLVEVGTTNKTHARDYEDAIGPATGLLLKVHRSNFAIVGFTAEVTPEERRRDRPRARRRDDDRPRLGHARRSRDPARAGACPTSRPSPRRSRAAPTSSRSRATSCSAARRPASPSARTAAVEAARKHPLMRALRPDKLTLAGLAATLVALPRRRRSTRFRPCACSARTREALHADAQQLAQQIGTVAG